MLKLVTAPAKKPVELDDIKEYVQVATADTTFDAFLNKRIDEAVEFIETYLGRSLITREYEYYEDAWQLNKDGHMEIPMSPVQEDGFTVQYYDSDDALQTWSAESYQLDVVSIPARLVPVSGESWPTLSKRLNAVKISMKCGHGDDPAQVPEAAKGAISVIVANKMALREDVVLSVPVNNLPSDKDALSMVQNLRTSFVQ